MNIKDSNTEPTGLPEIDPPVHDSTWFADALASTGTVTPLGQPAAAQEAVAPLGYVRLEAIKRLREDDEVTGVMVHVDARTDSVPVFLAPAPAAPGIDPAALRALSDRWANDRSYTGSPVDDIRALLDAIALASEIATDAERRKHAPCLECGAISAKDAEDKCRCSGDKDDCHGCQLWPDGDTAAREIDFAGLREQIAELLRLEFDLTVSDPEDHRYDDGRDESLRIADKVIALIDASPKGGGDARDAARWRALSALFDDCTTGRSERILEDIGLPTDLAHRPLSETIDALQANSAEVKP